MTDKTTVQYCVACGQVKPLDDYWWRKINYWQELAIANRKVAEDNQTRLAAVTKRRDECSNGWDEALINMETLRTELAAAQVDAERYRRVREFLQRGDGFLDTRGWDDAGFDGMIDSLKECGK